MTVSKVLERLVLTRLRPHLLGSANFSVYQSAYRKGHSTETALLEVLDGVYTAADNKQVTVLISLDLSAAFDTVDHEILLSGCSLEFGVTNTPLDSWAAPRILRWGYKTGFASGASEKFFFVPPLFQMWGTSKQLSVGAY